MPKNKKKNAKKPGVGGGVRIENGASDDDAGSVFNDNASQMSASSECSFFQTEQPNTEEPVDELSQEEQFLEKVKEAIDLATQKSAPGRTKAIDAVCHAFLKRYMPDFVDNRRVTVCDVVERSLKKGKGGELSSAAKLAVLLCLQLDDAEQVFKDLKSIMVHMAQDGSVAPTSRAAVVRSLAGLCFLGGGEMAEVVKMMNILEGIFSASFLRGDGSVPNHSVELLALHTAALDSWALLVTLLSNGDAYRMVDSHLRNLEGMFSSVDVDLRISAGETSALLLEAAYNYDEEYQPEGLDGLIGSLRQLATDSAKYRSKKDRKEQRSSFRDILRTVEEGESPREQVKFGRETLTLDSWVAKIQYDWLCKVLGTGLNLHLTENIMVREIFELGNPLPSINTALVNKPSKTERNAANQLAFKWRTQTRGKNRDKRVAVF